MGDEVLRVVGQKMHESVRAADLAARYGGEEFALVLPTADEQAARIVAERVRKVIASTKVPGPDGPISVTASLGIATVVGARARGARKRLFERADAALYESKRNGRNRVTTAPRE